MKRRQKQNPFKRPETPEPGSAPAQSKAPSDMTEAELDAEISRTEAALRKSKEEAVRIGREELAGKSSRRLAPPPRKRRTWS